MHHGTFQHFRHVLGRRLLVVWDRSNTHRDQRVKRFMAARTADYAGWFLPPYAPDLHPEEQANGVIKSRMANALLADIAELRALACRSIRYLQRHPRVVANFFGTPGCMSSNLGEAQSGASPTPGTPRSPLQVSSEVVGGHDDLHIRGETLARLVVDGLRARR